jgi:hypothetical protein
VVVINPIVTETVALSTAGAETATDANAAGGVLPPPHVLLASSMPAVPPSHAAAIAVAT